MKGYFNVGMWKVRADLLVEKKLFHEFTRDEIIFRNKNEFSNDKTYFYKCLEKLVGCFFHSWYACVEFSCEERCNHFVYYT